MFLDKNTNIKINAIIFYLFVPDSIESSHTLLAELCSVRRFLRSVLHTLGTGLKNDKLDCLKRVHFKNSRAEIHNSSLY